MLRFVMIEAGKIMLEYIQYLKLTLSLSGKLSFKTRVGDRGILSL
jgi:hypothetical protein